MVHFFIFHPPFFGLEKSHPFGEMVGDIIFFYKMFIILNKKSTFVVGFYPQNQE